MKPYPGYLFDLDGTLVDTAPDINVALNHALRRQGLAEVTETVTRHWVGHGAQALIRAALIRNGAKEPAEDQIDVLFQTFIDYYAAHIADLGRPYPGVVEALTELERRGARLGVVTNKLARLTEPLLAALALDRFFRTVVSRDTVAVPKPAPDPALHACATLRLEPAAVLFVGDSETDVTCARAAGCPVVVVADGYSHGIPAAELGADAVIESFSDLV